MSRRDIESCALPTVILALGAQSINDLLQRCRKTPLSRLESLPFQEREDAVIGNR